MVATVDEVLWAAKAPEEIVDTIAACEALRAHLAAVEAAALAEVEDRKIAKQHLAWSSTGDWYTHPPAPTPAPDAAPCATPSSSWVSGAATRDALRDGLVSPEQAAVIVDAIEELPTNPHLRELAEKTLLGEAGRLHATDLAKAARHLLHVVDPEGAERKAERDLDAQDRAAHLGRYLAITEDGAGGVRLRGRGTVEDAATIKAALLPLTKPAPAGSAGGDEECGEVEDVRDHGARMWDAMVQTCEHALSHRPAPRRPRRPAPGRGHPQPRRPQGQDRLVAGHRRRHRAVPGTARRLACDADVIPVVLGTRSEVLDVGRAHRLITPALWRALVCRDRHCAFPGCTRPPVMGHAHHLTHWADGGPTALDNLVLLCGHHHRTIHSTPWRVRLNPERRPAGVPAPAQTRAASPGAGVDQTPSETRVARTPGLPNESTPQRG